MTDYEKMIYPKGTNYAIFWIAFSVLFFLLQEIVIRLCGESGYLLFRALLIFVLCCIIIATIWLGRCFRNTIIELSAIMDFGDGQSWTNDRFRKIFSYKQWSVIIFIIGGLLIEISTFLFRTFPFHSTLPNIIWVLDWVLALVITAYSAHGLLLAFLVLKEIVNHPFQISFLRLHHPAIRSLTDLFLIKLSLIVLLFYCSAFLIFKMSPYGFVPETVLWVFILGFFPLSTFIWSFYQIHILFVRIKQEYLDQINGEVKKVFQFLQNKSSTENAEALLALLEIQKKAEQIREWPFALDGILTFLATLAIPVAQLVGYYMNSSK